MYVGRVIVPSAGKEMCLTVPDSTSGEGSRLIVAKCQSRSKPEDSQLFVWAAYEALFVYVGASS
jgi:hypothetical protein